MTMTQHHPDCICDRCCDEATPFGVTDPPVPVEPVTNDEFETIVRSRFAHGIEDKFTDADVTPEYVAWAESYLPAYRGDFDFLVDLKLKLKRYGSISTGQVRGVMNCFRAEVNRKVREEAKRAEAEARGVPSTPKQGDPPEGIHYADGVVYKVQAAVTTTGKLYAKRLSGTAWEYVGRQPFAHLSEATLMTRENAEEYGKLYGVCCMCGRLLTDERSIERGIGPVCAGRQGW